MMSHTIACTTKNNRNTHRKNLIKKTVHSISAAMKFF
jgi:hypothetical protein